MRGSPAGMLNTISIILDQYRLCQDSKRFLVLLISQVILQDIPCSLLPVQKYFRISFQQMLPLFKIIQRKQHCPDCMVESITDLILRTEIPAVRLLANTLSTV